MQYVVCVFPASSNPVDDGKVLYGSQWLRDRRKKWKRLPPAEKAGILRQHLLERDRFL